MVRKSFFGGLLALAVIATMSFFAAPADAKVRQCMIGGVPHYTAGEDGQVINATSWAEKGKVATLTWATPARKAVVEKRVRLPKAISAPAPKKNQVQKKATQPKQPNSKKASKKNIKIAAKVPMTGTAFQPVQPPTFLSRLWHGVEWIITGEWNMKPVIPTVIKPVPAPAQAVPPTKPLKKRVKKRAPPTKPCEQGIRATKFIPVAPKLPLRTGALSPKKTSPSPNPVQTVADRPAGFPKPALGKIEVKKKTAKVAEDKMPAGSDVRRYVYSVRTIDVDGNPILKKVTITHQSWNNLPSKEVRRGFVWLPGQVIPPDWMQEVGGKMNGIDPETGQIREAEIPKGIAINYSDRGNFATFQGKFSKVPDDRHLLKQINEERES